MDEAGDGTQTWLCLAWAFRNWLSQGNLLDTAPTGEYYLFAMTHFQDLTWEQTISGECSHDKTTSSFV
jgi:hypothetical protein